jgi:DNA-directed RNA polymerase specialized sigma24 family protein
MKYSELTDNELVSRILDGEEACLVELISRHEVEIFTVASNLTGDDNAAREVVEEVFVRLYRELSSFDGANFSQFVHGLAYDASLSRLVAGRALGGSFAQLFSIGQALVEGNENANADDPAEFTGTDN